MSDSPNKVSNMVPTADGTMTLRDKITGELYHNYIGAFFESIESYVLPARLEDIIQRRKPDSNDNGKTVVRLVDACFGMGYNTFALWHHILSKPHLPVDQIDVVGIEFDATLLETLPDILEQDCFRIILDELKDANGKTLADNLRMFMKLGLPTQSLKFGYQSTDGRKFNLHLIFDDLRTQASELAKNEAGQFDLIFHDPFSPSKHPHLWTIDLFNCYFKILRPHSGRLLTYCAATAVRSGLQQSGFSIFRTRDVGHKQGGTLAASGDGDVLFEDLIYALRPEELEKLKTISGIPYRDPTFNSTRKEVLHRRNAEQDVARKKQ